MRNLTFSLIVAAAAAIPVAAGATAPGKKGQIAFRRFFDDRHRSGAVFLINSDGSGERQLTHPPAGAIDAEEYPPSFAPDGSKLLFTRDQAGTSSLWTITTDGGSEQRLSPAGNRGYNDGVYAPDGRLIAFSRVDPPLKHFNLKVSLNVMAADGTHVRRLVNLGYRGDIGDISWSPDGRRVAYTALRMTKRPADALLIISAKGGRARRVTRWSAGDIGVDWSPNGRLLLVRFSPPNRAFGGDYYTLRPDGSRLRRLTHLGRKAMTGAARWSPDGTSIVFATNGLGGNDDIYVMRADGSGITPVTRTATWESAPAWGPAR